MRAARYSDMNLDELRSRLTAHSSTLLIALSGVAMWLDLARVDFPTRMFALGSALLIVGIGVRRLIDVRPTPARLLLVGGTVAGLVAAMLLIDSLWLPFLCLPLMVVSSLLISYSELAIAIAVGVVSGWANANLARAYPLPELGIALAAVVVLTWSIRHTLYTALQWAWTSQHRADELLELARDRQGELNRTLKSLELAYALQRRTQRDLVIARQQADEARRMKEQFAANISHELRTPLNLILGFSEIMYLSPEVYGASNWPPLLYRDIYHIYRSSRHLLEMIDDILDLSRFDLAQFTLNKEPTPLEPLLRSAAEIASDLFRARSIELKVVLPEELPTLEIDRTRIRQVLLNLLNNAQRFTEAGSVTLEARLNDREVIVSVRDTGRGIPADKIPFIFDEFYQVDHSLRREREGAGLGLAICRQFVQAHDGRIWVESEEGSGSTFYFTLPLPESRPSTSQPFVARPEQTQWPEERAAVLVVDPDPRVVALVDRRIAHFEAIQVDNPDRLPEEIALHHPQAVIYNVPPGTDGVLSSNLTSPVPIIECSLPSQSWMAHHLKVATCLTKPIAPRDLLAEIARLGDVRRVLIVDDDRAFCHLVERILQMSGKTFEVQLAYDGTDGLLAMRRQRPELVLLDLIMPGVDGFQVLDEMHSDPALADVPVILLTATSYAEDALSQRHSRIVIHQPGGLSLTQTLRCLEAVLGVLEPEYGNESLLEELAPAEAIDP